MNGELLARTREDLKEDRKPAGKEKQSERQQQDQVQRNQHERKKEGGEGAERDQATARNRRGLEGYIVQGKRNERRGGQDAKHQGR